MKGELLKLMLFVDCCADMEENELGDELREELKEEKDEKAEAEGECW